MTAINWKKLKRGLLILSLLLFVASLTQPAFYIDREDYDAWSNGFGLLVSGWAGALATDGGATAWFANPLILLAWILFSKFEKTATVLAIGAAAFAISFLSVEQVISSEAPTYSKITEIKLGYWLWLYSICTFAAGLLVLFVARLVVKSPS